jgi:hypothetical protein
MSRIAAQIQRLEEREPEWAIGPAEEVKPSFPEVRGLEKPPVDLLSEEDLKSQWELDENHARVSDWREILERLALDMQEQSKQPFSIRTRQISALSAFVPFVLAIMAAAVKHLPQMPMLSVWSKITWFIAFPMFLAMTGAFVGFLIGIMLDSMEAQAKRRPAASSKREGASEYGAAMAAASGVRTSVWVAVEDLEPNQRVAETVTGENGTPILLRHTLLKPSHIELLKKQNIQKIRVEAMKYPEGELALAG